MGQDLTFLFCPGPCKSCSWPRLYLLPASSGKLLHLSLPLFLSKTIEATIIITLWLGIVLKIKQSIQVMPSSQQELNTCWLPLAQPHQAGHNLLLPDYRKRSKMTSPNNQLWDFVKQRGFVCLLVLFLTSAPILGLEIMVFISNPSYQLSFPSNHPAL